MYPPSPAVTPAAHAAAERARYHAEFPLNTAGGDACLDGTTKLKALTDKSCDLRCAAGYKHATDELRCGIDEEQEAAAVCALALVEERLLRRVGQDLA